MVRAAMHIGGCLSLGLSLSSDRTHRAASEADEAPLDAVWHRQGLVDLSHRMRNGLLLYPVLWLALMLADGYMAHHPVLTWLNAGVLILVVAGRLAYHGRIRDQADVDLVRTRAIYRILSLSQNLYWGVLCAWIQLAPDAPDLRWLVLLCTVGITAGGTVIVSIDEVLPRLYPVVMLGPTVAVALWQGGSTGWVIAVLTVVMFLYSLGVSRMVGRDYWARLRSQALLEQRARELEWLSRTDALTQIPNRLMFEERLAVAWRDARRRQEPVAVAMVDLDHFKRINDTHGHPFGDRCLKAAAAALMGAARRPADVVARFGGEEFVVLMPNTDAAGAHQVAQRMLDAIVATVVHDGPVSVTLSCSVGVASARPHDGARADETLQHADAALYQAKQSGRGRVHLAD